MLSDSDRDVLDTAIEAGETTSNILVWEDDGVIWLQIGDDEPVYLTSPAEAIIAYLLCGAVGTPD